MSANSGSGTSPLHAQFQGQTVLVTGAGRGIGAAIALAFARAGADVALNDRPESAEVGQVVEACRACGVRATAVPADLADSEQVAALVPRTVEALGRLDVVVSNAAYSDRELFHQADLDEFRRTIDVTMWAPFYLVRAATRYFLEASIRGNVVVISSTHAERPIPGAMAYNMSKAALEQLVKTAATELTADGIRVNALRPGWVDTPGERKFFSEESIADVGKTLPMGRLERPDEIARGVLFLADRESEAINGSVLTLDGGIQLPVEQMYRLRQQPGRSASG